MIYITQHNFSPTKSVIISFLLNSNVAWGGHISGHCTPRLLTEYRHFCCIRNSWVPVMQSVHIRCIKSFVFKS